MNQTRCIASLYASCLGRYKNDKCWRILVKCTKEITRNEYLDLLGVYEIQIQRNAYEFFDLSEIDKKKYALEVLKEGVDKVIEQKGWDSEPFEKAYHGVIDANYINNWTWRKKATSPSKQYKAEVFCEHEIEAFHINLVIRNKKKEAVKRKRIITSRPTEFAFAQYFGRLAWESDNRVVLYDKFERNSWVLSLDE